MTDLMTMNANIDPPIPPEAPDLDYRKIAVFLWSLLDDIDTASDMFKENYEQLSDYVYDKQQRRFEVSASDGHELVFTKDTDHD